MKTIFKHSSLWTGITAAVLASSCCVLPLLAASSAFSGFATSLDWVAPFRPYLVGVSLALFGWAFYRAYRLKVVDCCAVKPSFWSSKGMLWVAFVVAMGAMTFPYYEPWLSGKRPAFSIAELLATSSSPMRDTAFVPVPAERISFYQTPLVCGASSTIGCGSRSKPLLLELEKNPQIRSAWLNHGGTLMAIIWNENVVSEKIRQRAVSASGEKYDVILSPVQSGSDFDLIMVDFNKGGWYRGSQVDRLSLIEAGIIADKVVRPVIETNALTAEITDSLRAEVERYFRVELVKFRSMDELYSDSLQSAWQTDVERVVEKYVGAEQLPELRIRFLRDQEKGCEKESNSCCKPNSGKSCCKQ